MGTNERAKKVVRQLREQYASMGLVYIQRTLHPEQTDGMYFSNHHQMLCKEAADVIERLLEDAREAT